MIVQEVGSDVLVPRVLADLVLRSIVTYVRADLAILLKNREMYVRKIWFSVSEMKTIVSGRRYVESRPWNSVLPQTEHYLGGFRYHAICLDRATSLWSFPRSVVHILMHLNL